MPKVAPFFIAIILLGIVLCQLVKGTEKLPELVTKQKGVQILRSSVDYKLVDRNDN